LGAWVCFEDEAGQDLRPPTRAEPGAAGAAPRWCGSPPQAPNVSRWRRCSAPKPGHRPRLIYRIHLDRGPAKGRRKGFTETDYARLLDAAHQQLGSPIVLVWDNLNTHVSRTMHELIAARLWLTVYQLPPYAPELNPVEGVWSHLKRSLANLTKHSLDQLTALVKTRLKRMQYRPRLIEGLIAKTGLDLQPP
jgi:transposase